jgi:uncharacterized RDD family membrane protein YckC
MGLPYNPYDPPRAPYEPPREADPHSNELASLGQRLGGAMLDGAFVMAAGLVPAIILHGLDLDPFPIAARAKVSFMPSELLTFCVSLFPSAVQWWLIARSGQTIGKKAVGTRIVTLDGPIAGFYHGVLLRWLPQLTLNLASAIFVILFPTAHLLRAALSIVLLVDILFIFGGERRCIHDYIAGTRVVRLRPG